MPGMEGMPPPPGILGIPPGMEGIPPGMEGIPPPPPPGMPGTEGMLGMAEINPAWATRTMAKAIMNLILA